MTKTSRKKFHIVAAGVCAVLLVTFAILTAVSYAISSSILSQKAAEFWSGDSGREYSQISVFFASDTVFTQNHVRDLRTAVEKTFTKIPSEYFGEGETPSSKSDMWIDAYSMETTISIVGDKSTINANAVISGGNFFYFRQFKFISGAPFGTDSLTFDKIVLDRDAAWQLFGSINVAGLTVWIGEHPFTVAGVVEKTATEAKSEIYGNSTRVYISYDAYEMYLNKSESELRVTCYEAVIPNPIKDFAYNSINDNLSSVNVDSRKIVVNSERYDIAPMWNTFKSLTMRSIRTKEIIYPFWENAASVEADRLSIITAVRLISIITVAITAILYLLWSLTKLAGKFKKKKYRYL